MELKTDQALHQAVTAQREGKLHEAETLYLAILESQPNHSDANHNLGLLRVSLGEATAALPLLENAIASNPNEDQFWLSYIKTLIWEKRLDDAETALSNAVEAGLSAEHMGALDAELKSRRVGHNFSKNLETGPTPSGIELTFDELLSDAIKHYEAGKLENAKEVAVSLCQLFPDHQVSWKVLGVVQQKMGDAQESLVAMQRSVELEPMDAEAHYNLGVTLLELGHLVEAEVSYKQALALKPDYAEAYSNLGTTLQELGRLAESEESYLQAIKLKPDDFRAHNYLGAVQTQLGKLTEAETSSQRALILRPGYAEAHNTLGVALDRQGRLEEAKASYESAIELKMGFNLAQDNLASTLRKLGELEEAADRKKRIKYLRSIEKDQNLASDLSNTPMFLRPSPLEYPTLFRPGMGTENVGSFLRAMVQMLRPKTILEVGAGYTTPFLLEGIVNNERVFDDGNLQSSYFEDYTYEAKLVVIDDMSLGELIEKPGMKEIISSPYTDFIEGSFEGKEKDLQEKYKHFDFVWFDCGGLAEYKTFVRDYWDICSGYIFFHFTYTFGNPNDLHETIMGGVNGNAAFFDIVEPHKGRQGSITMVRKDG